MLFGCCVCPGVCRVLVLCLCVRGLTRFCEDVPHTAETFLTMTMTLRAAQTGRHLIDSSKLTKRSFCFDHKSLCKPHLSVCFTSFVCLFHVVCVFVSRSPGRFTNNTRADWT